MDQTGVTVQAMDELVKKYNALEAEKDALSEQVTGKNKEMAVVAGQLTAHMKELGREEYDSPYGKCKIARAWTVNNPQTDEDKEALFQHLRERGIFEKYATVNNASLNALYKKDLAAAEAKGEAMEFSMPGIGAPKVFETTKIKAAK